MPAHPRVGGENSMWLGLGVGRAGSSPRRRGKQGLAAFAVEPGWLIPA